MHHSAAPWHLIAAATAALGACTSGPDNIQVQQADGGGAERTAVDAAAQDVAALDRSALDAVTADSAAADGATADGQTPDARTTDLRTTDVRTTDVQTTDVRTTDLATTDLPTNDLRTTDLQTTDLRTTDVRTTDVQTTDVRTTDLATTDLPTTDLRTTDAATADAVVPDGGGSDARCPAAALGAQLGHPFLLVGGAMDDEDFADAPFDLGYHYVAGDVPADGPCQSCAQGCTVRGQSCANSAGCAWWGCWQWDQLPPGRFVADYLSARASAGAVPMITYYIWYSVAGDVEGATEIAQLQDGARVRAYLDDFRFLCQVMAEDPDITALLHLEPDLWGYGHQIDDDPTQIPVALQSAGADECAGQADHLTGLAGCLLAIARAHAPNVLVGFHASAWGAGHDALVNSDPDFDLAGHAAETAAYMRALGADAADLVVVEMSDRDAAFSNRWWDATDATLPSFVQAIAWVQGVGQGLGLAPLWWQVPYGHMGLDNVCDRYQDNRVDYFFDHPAAFAAGGALGIAFGAGAGCQTTPATDDGNFVDRAQTYYSGARPPLCGP